MEPKTSTVTNHKFLNFPIHDLRERGKELHDEYVNNLPFPNISIDEFFNPDILDKILEEFPQLGAKKEDIFYENPNEIKYASKGEYRFGNTIKEFMHFMNSQPFLEFLQELSGIKETLIPDPYFEGGGCHQIKKGGFLKLHVDFHKHKLMNLDRRLNVLVYLNKDWEEEYGGHFELWERDMSKAVVKIAPLFNRMAIFSTTGDSWHGHPDPLTCPEGMSRKSLALYFYTNGRPSTEVSAEQRNRITTTFSARKGMDSSKMKTFNNMVNVLNDVLPPFLVRWIKKLRNK